MYNMDMEKLETQLKKQGWKIEEFQPKGEKYPWSLKISKKINTKGLHTDLVTEKIRQSAGSYVITAYLDVNKKLDIKTRETRIKSAIRWELIKNYSLLAKYTWLEDLQEIVGKVKPITLKKKVHKAITANSNEVALKEEKEAKSSESKGENTTNDKQDISAKKVPKTASKQAKTSAKITTEKVPKTTSKVTKKEKESINTQKQVKNSENAISPSKKKISKQTAINFKKRTNVKKTASTENISKTVKMPVVSKGKVVKKTENSIAKKPINKNSNAGKNNIVTKKVTKKKGNK